jgi:glutamate synthase domain-containing protein 3
VPVKRTVPFSRDEEGLLREAEADAIPDRDFRHEEGESEKEVVRVDAGGMGYRELNTLLRSFNGNGVKKVEIRNVYGQRYIGTDLEGSFDIEVYGTPGNDLGAFMNGPTVTVHGNAQDGCGNTMDKGKIVIHGYAGDIVGYSMRGGRIFIRDNAGYRVGIHMKEYHEKRPVIVVGGTAQDFLGEYMAGGVVAVLGLTLSEGEKHHARFVGTGMHGGKMYIRGTVSHLAKEVAVVGLEVSDRTLLHDLIDEYSRYFDVNLQGIRIDEFNKLIPASYRPYGKLYSK